TTLPHIWSPLPRCSLDRHRSVRRKAAGDAGASGTGQRPSLTCGRRCRDAPSTGTGACAGRRRKVQERTPEGGGRCRSVGVRAAHFSRGGTLSPATVVIFPVN